MQKEKDQKYKIKVGRLPVGPGTHVVIGLFDPAGKLIREMNGLSTSSKGDVIPMGIPFNPWDRLYAYDNPTRFMFRQSDEEGQEIVFEGVENSYWGNVKSRSVVEIFVGSAEAVEEKWRRARIARNMINDQHLGYGWNTQNSNSVANTLVRSMGLTLPRVGWLTPARGKMLIDLDKAKREADRLAKPPIDQDRSLPLEERLKLPTDAIFLNDFTMKNQLNPAYYNQMLDPRVDQAPPVPDSKPEPVSVPKPKPVFDDFVRKIERVLGTTNENAEHGKHVPVMNIDDLFPDRPMPSIEATQDFRNMTQDRLEDQMREWNLLRDAFSEQTGAADELSTRDTPDERPPRGRGSFGF